MIVYRLDFHTDSKSKSEQLTKWVKTQDYNINEAYSYNKSRQGFTLSNKLKLPLLEKVKGGKLKDYLPIEGLFTFFMILSQNAMKQISKLNLPKYDSFELRVKDDSNFKVYNAIHFNEHLTQYIVNWNASTFAIKPRGYKKEAKKSGITFDSYDHYLICKKETANSDNNQFTLVKENLVYDPLIFNKYDLIYSIGPALGYYCSNNFLEVIINNNLEGFKIDRIERFNL